ncbi:MAG: hypothetical protein L6R41_002083 [Letrouitia leprolyta]|nr:MAG: hypothetical protein L6R41_002083 [Letrouitia leprolyta]
MDTSQAIQASTVKPRSTNQFHHDLKTLPALGDADDRARLEEEAQDFDPSQYWSNHPQMLQVMAAASRAKAQADSLTPSMPLYNPYEGQICGRQLSEAVEDFLKRLPPLTTHVNATCPWIFIANPYARSRPTDYDQGRFMQAAERLLEEYTEQKNGIESSMAGKAKGTMTKKLTPLRKVLEERLLAKAKETKFTIGKWMLFPYPENVNEQWAIVAEATANRELGTAAKVAPDNDDGDRKPRLICVYTKDFSDMEDVKRVLERLIELGLVKRKGAAGAEQGIYYKADAFTELGITSGNEWGLKPSLYSSKELLDCGKK